MWQCAIDRRKEYRAGDWRWFRAMLLLLPWFRLDPWVIALPFDLSIKLQPFGMFAVVAMFVCAYFARRRADQLGLDRQLLSSFLSRVTLVGIISAYVLNIVLYAPEQLTEIRAQPWKLFTRWYGLSSYGGFVGGALAAWHFTYKRGAPLLRLGDAWCFSFPFAWFFARMGCFCVHDHPGVASDFALAIADWNGSGIARHDLGLYEVLWSVPVALLFWRISHNAPRPGLYLALLSCTYGPTRFALDFLRADEANGGDIRYAAFTPAQYLSLALTTFGTALLLHQRNQRPHDAKLVSVPRA